MKKITDYSILRRTDRKCKWKANECIMYTGMVRCDDFNEIGDGIMPPGYCDVLGKFYRIHVGLLLLKNKNSGVLRRVD